MVVGEKSHQKLSGWKYRKVFNKNDPFDQLIIELGLKGILDVCVIGIGDKQAKHPEHEYSRGPIIRRGRHTS